MQQRSITPVVLTLIVINVAIHLFTVFSGSLGWAEFRGTNMLLSKLGDFGLPLDLSAADQPIPFNPWQLLGSAFAHSEQSHLHIIFNMMCLFFFGPTLERAMGSLRFIVLYLFCAIVGGLIAAYFTPSLTRALGASGAISGLLVAFAWLFPKSKMGLLFIPIYIPSRIFTSIFAAISLGLVIYQFVGGPNIGGISHIGHLGGVIAGLIFMLGYGLIRPKPLVTA